VKVIVRKEALRQILKWTQRVLFAGAILLLGYCAFALGDAWLFQRRAARDLGRLQRDRRAASQLTPQPVSVIAPRVAPVAGSLIGRIQIARLDLSVVVVEGVDRISLRRAVGHIPGTALPGEAGNVGLAGHRDTFFRQLKDVKIDDEIQISTLTGNFKYQVVALRIVDPENVAVLAASGENVLTLVTCYPFYFVGPAPKRWIVRARQVSSQAVAPSSVK
jgi:sortase A